ncbi:MAG: ankyrin repeat domain-containing protein [Rhodoferax sp.]|nr:ankyrin repeat domain-containing protein [Rhodoferax sp.]
MSPQFLIEQNCSSCGKLFTDTLSNISPTLYCTTCKTSKTSKTSKILCKTCATDICEICGTSLREKNNTYPTVLFNAIKEGDIERVHQICCTEHGDISNEINDKGDTPIIYSAICNEFKICEYLISIGASARNKYGRTALMEMIRCRSAKWSPELAALFSGSVNEQDCGGQTALMFASVGAGVFGSRRGNIRILEQLLSFGADPTMKDKHGYTALGHAIKANEKSKTSNNQEMVSRLEIEIVNFVAHAEFRKSFTHSFDPKGNLVLSQLDK